jgi:glycosyltransferase involved in cell wall biosynthesis
MYRPDLHPMKIKIGFAERDRELAFISEVEKHFKVIILKEEEEFNTDLCDIYEIIIVPSIELSSYSIYKFLDKNILVRNDCLGEFKRRFSYCIDNNILLFDNLINLLIMVKDAGDGFREMLEHNLQFVDYLTVLDTGSTDGTVKVVKDILTKHKGILYERPWKNFRDSRNELLDLAGDKFVFNLMLDDTYRIHGNIREFLTLARADDEADSYSIFIKNSFLMYSSNRISKPKKGLRYKYTIHEILEDNNNFEIPHHIAWLTDNNNEYMEKRTQARKKNDLELLLKEYENNPSDPRSLYYLGETYLCLKDWENAYKYYELRKLNNRGFSQEVQDSLYKIATISYFHLNKEWEICKQLYLECFEYDQSRPESLYIIGYHYNKIKDNSNAYKYLQEAYNVSLCSKPNSMNSKYKIKLYEIPKLLVELCYMFKNYKLGFECSQRCLNYEKNFSIENSTTNFQIWLSIFYLCLELEKENNVNFEKTLYNNRKTICFLAPGGWDKWDGETLRTKGLGGSETCIIKFAEEMVKLYENMNIIIVCNCEINEKIYKNVTYININNFPTFINKYNIECCIINRYPEYIPICEINNIQNIHLVLHDMPRNNEIIPITDNLKNIICLSYWHAEQIKQIFPQLKDKITVMSYGIEVNTFPEVDKIPYSFIYPSFPNRGLIPLLEMWPCILKKYPSAILNIFCNTKQEWLQTNCKEYMDKIDELLVNLGPSVINHGWVSEETLKKFWCKSHIWLYPCTFKETFCRVALEAAASKTLVVTSDLAALNETVGDRGIIIEGDPNTERWKNQALKSLFKCLDENNSKFFIEKNYQ